MEKRFPFRRNQSVFWRFLLSSLFPCLLATLVWAVFSLPTFYKNAEESDRAYKLLLTEQTQVQIKRLTDTVEDCSSKMENNTWCRPLYINILNGREPSAVEKQSIINELAIEVAGHPLLAHISFRFYEDKNVLYTEKGIVKNLEYFEKNGYTAIEYCFISPPKDTAAFTQVTVDGIDYLVYSSSFRDIPEGRPKGELNLFFKTKQLGDALYAATDCNAGAVRLKDQTGKTVWEYSCGMEPTDSEELCSPAGIGRYVFAVSLPESVLSQTRLQMRRAVFSTLWITLLVSVLVSWLLSKSTYRPLQDLLWKYFGKKSTNKNEFFELGQLIDHLHPLARQKLLGSILDGTVDVDTLPPEELSDCGISFGGTWYNVISLEMPFSQGAEDLKERTAIAGLTMEAILLDSGRASRCNACLYYKDADHYQILVDYNSEEQLQEFLHSLYEACHSFLKKHGIKSGCYFGISTPAKRLQDVYHIAAQAETAANYAALNRLERFAVYREISDRVVYDYYYPMEEELLLSRTIVNGDTGRAIELLKEIIRGNRKEKQMDPDKLWLLYMDLTSTVARSGRSLGLTLPVVDLHKRALSLEEIETIVGAMICDICQKILQQRQKTASQSEQEILDYIDCHLYDADLSLNSIADEFQKSQTYISILFKEQKGTNYNNYVNKARVLRAIQLMAEQELDYNAVYPLVGFSSLSTFKRNYNRYVNTSAGNPEDAEEKGDAK